MSTPFFEKSREIADNFIQSVLFVDDEIYNGDLDSDHSLDSKALVEAFSRSKKLCALNNPKTESDFDDIIYIAQKADISVLDWKIHLEGDAEEGNEEEDVEELDPRGTFTLKLIKELLDKKQGEFKLILIFTGETILNQIADSIFEQFSGYGLKKIKDNIIGKQNFRIIVAGKPTLEGRLNHTPELKNWIVQYGDIPKFLLEEFTKMTEGLISNVALHALTSIRNSSFKLLSFYNKEIDPAFLTHRALLPIVDDAGEILKESILTSIKAILDYDEVERKSSYQQISRWIDQYSFSDKTLKIGKKVLSIKKKELKKWQKEGFINAITNIWLEQFPNDQLDHIKLGNIYKEEIHKDSLKFFMPDESNILNIEERFSILTHHKSNYADPSYTPKLSLGTIVKGGKTGNYWICIQQRCDSVRIKEDEIRRFLFLPLSEVEGGKKFNFLVCVDNNNIKLAIDNDTHKVRTIKFKANKNEAVYARRFGKSNKLFFQPFYYKGHASYNQKYDENFIWVLDLKDDHAQRIANNYAVKLSRVGLDESEWLRRWGGN